MPPITVLIPVRNVGHWLRETLASVHAQTFKDWKLIAIDDGSSDNSPDILRDAEKNDPRIKVVVRPNKGLVETRNELLYMADTDLVAWLDSDDRMTPDRLQLQLARFAEEPALVCCGGAATLTDPDGLPIKTHAFPTDHESLVQFMRKEIAFYFPSVTIKRQTAVDIGGFRHPAVSEDFDMCLRLSEVGRVANLPQVLVYYRQHLASAANSIRNKTYILRQVVLDLAEERRTKGSDRLQRGEPLNIDFGPQPTAKQNAATTHERWAWWALHDRHLKTARKYAWTTLRERPLSVASWRLLACAIRGH
jgi:glycosyltransferase involved in cell wall biosynthesis